MDLGKTVLISEFPVQSTNRQRLSEHLLSAIPNKKRIALFFVNTNFIVKCRFILEHGSDKSLIFVNDGLGMDIAALLMYRRRFEENLNGTDFTPYLFRQSSRPLRVFLLGGRPEVVATAARYVREEFGQDVVGFCDGYDGLANTPGLVDRINQTEPEVVLVAMGNPVQEEWILRHRSQLNANVFIGVGALFDFWSGRVSRAPVLVRRFRFEWLYRLCLEPRRLMRRYTFDILIFLRHCFKYR